MVTRIVRMAFEPEKVSDFLSLFEGVSDQIRAFEGCHHLELLRDTTEHHVFYTVSKWTSEPDLEKYRSSDFFVETWTKTKLLFCDKPIAYSLLPV